MSPRPCPARGRGPLRSECATHERDGTGRATRAWRGLYLPNNRCVIAFYIANTSFGRPKTTRTFSSLLLSSSPPASPGHLPRGRRPRCAARGRPGPASGMARHGMAAQCAFFFFVLFPSPVLFNFFPLMLNNIRICAENRFGARELLYIAWRCCLRWTLLGTSLSVSPPSSLSFLEIAAFFACMMDLELIAFGGDCRLRRAPY